MTREEIFSNVTERIMACLRDGVVPWRKPWGEERIETAAPLALPRNAKTNKTYQGVNITLLWMSGYESPYWATEKVWSELGASIKADETPVVIFFHSFLTLDGRRRPFLRDYKVYNLEQVYGADGLRSYSLAHDGSPDYTVAEELIAATGATILDNPSNAWYDVQPDVIHRPPRRFFKTDIGYYTTVLHELTHWSGNPLRLNRVFGRDNGTREYALEEMIAELGTCFVAATLDIPERLSEMPNHANYIGEWLSQLGGDSQAFFRASSAAQKAANFLLKYGGVSCNNTTPGC